MSNLDYKLQLEKAIADLYKVFAAYPLNLQMKGCPCCVHPKENELLLTRSLRSLTANNLNHYAFNAALTWGDINDLKHFLPRLLELWAFDKDLFYGEFVISRLSTIGLANWEEKERKAIEQYLISLWQYILSEYPSPSTEVADLIDCLSDTLDDFELLLSMWQNHSSSNSLLHLSDFILYGFEFNRIPVSSIYLSEVHTHKFFNWVTQDKLIQKIEQYIYHNLEEDRAEQLAMTVDILNCAKIS